MNQPSILRHSKSHRAKAREKFHPSMDVLWARFAEGKNPVPLAMGPKLRRMLGAQPLNCTIDPPEVQDARNREATRRVFVDLETPAGADRRMEPRDVPWEPPNSRSWPA